MPKFINFLAAREWDFIPAPIRRVYYTIREWTAAAASGRLLASIEAAGGPPPPVEVDEEGYTPLWAMRRGYFPPEVPEGGVFMIEEV